MLRSPRRAMRFVESFLHDKLDPFHAEDLLKGSQVAFLDPLEVELGGKRELRADLVAGNQPGVLKPTVDFSRTKSLLQDGEVSLPGSRVRGGGEQICHRGKESWGFQGGKRFTRKGIHEHAFHLEE